MTIAYRPALPRDREFIVGAWESSYQDSHTSGMIPMVLWADTIRPIVEHYLDRQYARTIVAYNPDDAGGVAELHGFICGEPDEKPPIVYYCYVIQPLRRGGIARRLFSELGVDPAKPFTYLCSTRIVPRLAAAMPLAKWLPNRPRYSREARRPYR